jgi:hypothetical protein
MWRLSQISFADSTNLNLEDGFSLILRRRYAGRLAVPRLSAKHLGLRWLDTAFAFRVLIPPGEVFRATRLRRGGLPPQKDSLFLLRGEKVDRDRRSHQPLRAG